MNKILRLEKFIVDSFGIKEDCEHWANRRFIIRFKSIVCLLTLGFSIYALARVSILLSANWLNLICVIADFFIVIVAFLLTFIIIKTYLFCFQASQRNVPIIPKAVAPKASRKNVAKCFCANSIKAAPANHNTPNAQSNIPTGLRSVLLSFAIVRRVYRPFRRSQPKVNDTIQFVILTN